MTLVAVGPDFIIIFRQKLVSGRIGVVLAGDIPVRDKRFVAVHRGGPLARREHQLLAAWAAACAEHVLSLFESCHEDERPRQAIEVGRSWERGEIPVGVAQKASLAAHAAARTAGNGAATAAARAAGHAVATAHAADHSLGATIYACKAVALSGGDGRQEREWQIAQLPVELRELVVSALDRRSTKHDAGSAGRKGF
jgi:hypothetical protein